MAPRAQLILTDWVREAEPGPGERKERDEGAPASGWAAVIPAVILPPPFNVHLILTWPVSKEQSCGAP